MSDPRSHPCRAPRPATGPRLPESPDDHRLIAAALGPAAGAIVCAEPACWCDDDTAADTSKVIVHGAPGFFTAGRLRSAVQFHRRGRPA